LGDTVFVNRHQAVAYYKTLWASICCKLNLSLGRQLLMPNKILNHFSFL
jgi:hypothetical protein